MITHETDLHGRKYYEIILCLITQWTIELNSNDILSEKLEPWSGWAYGAVWSGLSPIAFIFTLVKRVEKYSP